MYTSQSVTVTHTLRRNLITQYYIRFFYAYTKGVESHFAAVLDEHEFSIKLTAHVQAVVFMLALMVKTEEG